MMKVSFFSINVHMNVHTNMFFLRHKRSSFLSYIFLLIIMSLYDMYKWCCRQDQGLLWCKDRPVLCLPGTLHSGPMYAGLCWAGDLDHSVAGWPGQCRGSLPSRILQFLPLKLLSFTFEVTFLREPNSQTIFLRNP